MELVKSEPEKQAFAALNDIQQYYVRLKSEPSILHIKNESEVKRACLEIITKAMMDQSPNGQPDEKILQFQSQVLFNELTGKYKSLTLSELREAFRLGIRGETGPYFGLCAKTYSQFIKWWFDKDERGKAWELYISKVNGWKLAEKPALDKSFFFKACERAYKKYRESATREMPEVPFCLYDFIKEYIGAETLLNKDEWDTLKHKIKADALISYKNKIKHSALKDIAANWKLCINPQSPDYNNMYANSIKEAATKYYFESLIKQGKQTIK